ncbi:MAG: nucleotide exchange factor GrpE [Halioglobus sp.]
MAEQDPKQPENEVQEEQTANPEVQLETAEEVAAAEAAQASSEDDTEVSLDDELTQLQEDLLAARDAALRAQADAQNVKRRAEQDVEKARKYALERFAGELLPVVDNLERALEAASGDDEAIKPIAEGVELTLKSFIDVLGKNKVDVVDPQGEPFDPNLHQAITMVENKEVEPNTVTAVMQKGYSLNGRLIRPAMVMVSKGG